MYRAKTLNIFFRFRGAAVTAQKCLTKSIALFTIFASAKNCYIISIRQYTSRELNAKPRTFLLFATVKKKGSR